MTNALLPLLGNIIVNMTMMLLKLLTFEKILDFF